MNNTEAKTMKFTIESTAKPVEKDGKTVVEMNTEVHADITNASTEQIVALLAYLGDVAVKKTVDEFKNRNEKPAIQSTAEKFFAKRDEMMNNLHESLAKAMLKEMIADLMMAMKEKGGDKPAATKAEEPEKDADGDDAPASGGDTTIVIVNK